jgi:hypothetical protein
MDDLLTGAGGLGLGLLTAWSTGSASLRDARRTLVVDVGSIIFSNLDPLLLKRTGSTSGNVDRLPLDRQALITSRKLLHNL